jgi:hypothetical protein
VKSLGADAVIDYVNEDFTKGKEREEGMYACKSYFTWQPAIRLMHEGL